MNKQMLATFTILLFALAITGYTYSTWIKTINIQNTIETAQFEILIQNHNTTLNPQMSTDNHTLEIQGNISIGETLWTGIIIKNNGTTPTTITYKINTNDSLTWQTNFTHSEHFYGPYTETDDISPVWDQATTMPPSDGSTTPPELLAQNMLVIWQNITLNETPPQPFTIEITVTYTATWQGWTDAVSVIYTLTYQQGET